MQEPHGATEADLGGAHDHPFAAHAAQVGQRAAGAKAAAVDHGPVAVAPGRPRATEVNLHARPPGFLEQERHRLAWREVRLPRVEQTGGEPALEVGLELGDSLAVEALVSFRQSREVLHLAPVARCGHHQRAAHDGAGISVAPQADRLEPEIAHDRRIHFGLAERAQHGAAIAAGGIGERFGRPLDEPHAMAPAGQRQRLPQAGDAGADNGDGRFVHSRGRRSVSPRHAFAPRVGAAFQAPIAAG